MTKKQAKNRGLRGLLRAVPRPASLKTRIVLGFSTLVLILAVVSGTAAWQQHIHQENLASLEKHSKVASELQGAEAEGATAALVVQRYVDTGDQTYIPEIQDHAKNAVDDLSSAVIAGAPPGMDQAAMEGATLAQGAGDVVALQQAGNGAAAKARMEEIVPVFHSFRLRLEGATAAELRQVSSLRASADRTGTITLWLLIISGVVGSTIGLSAAFLIARSITRPLASLEETAVAVSRGDFSARASAGGPRELAQFGSVLNDMVCTVQERTEDLRRANQVLQDRNRQLSDARAQAATDPLTGLGNHRSFHRRIRADIARCERKDEKVGLVLFDVDGFKGINDSLGHLAGDEILRDLSLVMQKMVSPADAYRYGGDEFAVIIPGADARETTCLAEQLRMAVCEDDWSGKGRVTISLGITSFPEMGTSAEEIIYRADMAMYWAKSTGKNRVGDWDGLISRRSDTLDPRYFNTRGVLAEDSVAGLTAALAAKDPGTRDHIERCSWYAARLADELGLDDAQKNVVRLAALLHDVGKLAIPIDVICKPGPLDEDEWRLMRLHPVFGRHMLEHVEAVADAVPAIFHHHEQFDGSGYPDGLEGSDIPIASRILMVCDAFDAMTTDRPYRQAMSIDAATAEIREHRGTQFDPQVVEAFLRMLSREGAHPLRMRAGVDGASSTANGDGAAARVRVSEEAT